jgi:aspartate/glutamate racemase
VTLETAGAELLLIGTNTMHRLSTDGKTGLSAGFT